MSDFPLKASAVSLRYEAVPDRILCQCHGANEARVDLWLTRRLLLQMAPKLAEWIARQTPAATHASASNGESTDVAQQQTVARFEHDLAQMQVPLTANPDTEGKAALADVLVHTIQLSVQGEQILVAFAGEDGKVLVHLVATRPELHRIVGQLIALAEKGAWGIADPWSGRSGAAVAGGSSGVH